MTIAIEEVWGIDLIKSLNALAETGLENASKEIIKRNKCFMNENDIYKIPEKKLVKLSKEDKVKVLATFVGLTRLLYAYHESKLAEIEKRLPSFRQNCRIHIENARNIVIKRFQLDKLSKKDKKKIDEELRNMSKEEIKEIGVNEYVQHFVLKEVKKYFR